MTLMIELTETDINPAIRTPLYVQKDKEPMNTMHRNIERCLKGEKSKFMKVTNIESQI